MNVRTRFSPSPTGMIHLGNARAAIFSAMYAKKNQGVFVLRIEDTDASRSLDEHVDSLQADLKWLNIHWQEGPGVDGPYGPYWQSQRQSIYEKYFKILENKKLIYPCFCSDQELALSRKLQLSRGQAPRYAGTCQHLSIEDINQRLSEEKKPTWRFKVPTGTTIRFEDVVKGPQEFKSDDIGDFIIRRADGTAPFLFCNAIDDAEMKISHVLRGEDHVANTPRQILILKTLDLPIPHYGHMPLIVGEDGAPLSKRHGSFSVQELRSQGYLPIAIVNYLARLSHTCDTQALLGFDELSLHFNLEKLSRSPARFDVVQLMYWQKLAVQSLDQVTLERWIGEKAASQIPEHQKDLFNKTIQNNITFPQQALEWANIFFQEKLNFDKEELKILQQTHEQFFVEAELAVDKYGIAFNEVIKEMGQTLNLTGKKLFLPLRIALTGKAHGPELVQIAALLGPEKMKHRLSRAFKLATGKE